MWPQSAIHYRQLKVFDFSGKAQEWDSTFGVRFPRWFLDRHYKKGRPDTAFYKIHEGLQDYTGGLRSDLRYKRFDFSVLASFGIGGDFYDGNYQALMGGIRATGNNASVDLLNSWRSTADAGDGHTPILRTQLNYGSQIPLHGFYMTIPIYVFATSPWDILSPLLSSNASNWEARGFTSMFKIHLRFSRMHQLELIRTRESMPER